MNGFIVLTDSGNSMKMRVSIRHILSYGRPANAELTWLVTVRNEPFWRVDETPDEIDALIAEAKPECETRRCSACGVDYVWIHSAGSYRADCPACGHDEIHAIVREALKADHA